MKLLYSIDSSGRRVNREYSIEDKIKYYSRRINDKSLTQDQRTYAAIKTRMLTSGVGRIVCYPDRLLGNDRFQDINKMRRLVVVAKNQNNKKVLVNGLYSNNNKFRKEISTYYSPGEDGNENFSKIPILHYDNSYLNIQSLTKDKDNFYNISDFIETTSTVDPFDLDKIRSFVFNDDNNKYLNTTRKYNRYLRNKLYK